MNTLEEHSILTFLMLFCDTYDLSKTKVKNLLDGGGLYVNNIKLETDRAVTMDDFLYKKYCLLRIGKRNYQVVTI